MTLPGCTRLADADLIDYAAGDLSEAAEREVEEHLFSCGDCAARGAAIEGLLRAIPPAVRSAEVGGFVTDAILNRLAREGVRVRSYALSPGAVVPCAVWEGDELMALRLHGNFEGVGELTLSQRVGGAEVSRATGEAADSASGEVIFTIPASSVRDLPVVEIDVLLTARQDGEERTIGRYTLAHGGALRR